MRKVRGLPKAVKVGPHTFTVVERGKAWEAMTGAYGHTNYNDYSIDVVTEHRLSNVVDTLLHEIFHAIFYTYDLKDEDVEEKVVRVGTTAWLQVMRDNPELMTFVNKSVKKIREVEDV